MRRAAPLLLVIVMLLPQAAMASAWYQCSADRLLRANCCCPGDKDGETQGQPTRSELRQAECCDVVTAEQRRDSARVEPTSASRVPSPVLLDVLVPLSGLVASFAGAGTQAPLVHDVSAPPADPIYLRHASLLL